MPDLLIVRGNGDKRGEDIIDPLLTTEAVCLVRARNAIDEAASGLQPITVECVYQRNAMPGKVALFYDQGTGNPWYGKITSVTHTSGREVTTTLVVERPTNFEV